MQTQYGKWPIEIVNGKARFVRGGVERSPSKAAAKGHAVQGILHDSRQNPVVPTGRLIGNPVSSPEPAPIYDSQTEAQWASELAVELRLGVVLFIQHHPFTLALPGGVLYTPDFLVVRLVDGRTIVQIDEVKGWSKNVRDGVTRWKIAAGLMPWFEWRLVRRVKRRWSVTARSNGRR